MARALLEARLGDAGAEAIEAVLSELDGPPSRPHLDESRRILEAFLAGDDIAQTVALTPVEARHRLTEHLADLLATPVDGAPTVVVVEDVQWADPTSLEVLAQFLERIAASPMLVILTARPDFETPWSDSSNRNSLWLTPLSDTEIRDLVSGALARFQASDDVVETVVARTDGVPLFAEELARTLQGRINDGDWVPDSLSDSLLARLDRLGADRPVAQAASVIGREFSVDEVERVLGGGVDCDAALRRLEREDIVEHAGRASQYRFRHALVQQAAYDSLLLRTRRQAHERLAEMLADDGFAAEVIARHWTAAERPSEAVGQWTIAGDRAMRSAAHLEAAEHFAAAIAQLALLPESSERHHNEMDLQLKRAGACQFSKGFAAKEVQAAVSRAMALTELTGDPKDQVQTLYGALTTTTSSGQLTAVGPIAVRLEEAAEASGDPIDLSTAHVGCASAALNMGRFVEALDRSRIALELIAQDPGRAGTNPPLARLYGGLAAYDLGDVDALVELGEPLLEVGEVTTDDPFSDLVNTNMALVLSKTMAPDDRTIRLADRLRENAAANGLDFMTLFADLYGGWAQAMQGDPEGVAVVQRGLDLQLATQQYLYLDDSFRSLAEAQLHSGDPLSGLESIGQAVRHVAQPHHEIHVYRVRAELLAALDADPDDIEREYTRARAVEPDVHMPVARLLLAISDARWRLGRGDLAAARAVIEAAGPEELDPRVPAAIEAGGLLAEVDAR
ncbi:MAG: AAA family ATPase [Actinomycetota bacterium]